MCGSILDSNAAGQQYPVLLINALCSSATEVSEITLNQTLVQPLLLPCSMTSLQLKTVSGILCVFDQENSVLVGSLTM